MTGEFCSGWNQSARSKNKLSMPRCYDCAYTNASAVNTTECELLLGATMLGGQRLAPWGDDLKAWDPIDHTMLELTDPLLDHYAERTRIDCLAWQHCSATDVMPGQCDYMVLNDRVMHGTRQFLVAFLALLLSLIHI